MGHSRSRWGIVEEEVEVVLKNMARHDMGLEEFSIRGIVVGINS